ncbi:MAG: helix-turn-helix domain-containing protein [Candidatus Dormibacteria bacterium]
MTTSKPSRARESVFPGFAEVGARSRRELAAQLVAQRQQRGLSQTQVAARMGTSQSAVARLEGGSGDLRVSTLERYAQALDRRLGWRLELADPAGDADG